MVFIYHLPIVFFVYMSILELSIKQKGLTMKAPHITREYIESLSLENARTLQMMLAAQWSEENGGNLSIADNVSLAIEFSTRNSQCERILDIY